MLLKRERVRARNIEQQVFGRTACSSSYGLYFNSIATSRKDQVPGAWKEGGGKRERGALGNTFERCLFPTCSASMSKIEEGRRNVGYATTAMRNSLQ